MNDGMGGFPVPGKGTAIKEPPQQGEANVKFQAGTDSSGPYGNDPEFKGMDKDRDDLGSLDN